MIFETLRDTSAHRGEFKRDGPIGYNLIIRKTESKLLVVACRRELIKTNQTIERVYKSRLVSLHIVLCKQCDLKYLNGIGRLNIQGDIVCTATVYLVFLSSDVLTTA